MAYIINEQQMIESNIFKYEERLNSKFSRFLDKTPNFVTYYHLNDHETMVDNGFQNVETIIGCRSSIRFQKINNFPLYGLEQIIIQLEDGESGLDGNYEGDAIILPNTIRPLENDFFIIDHLSRFDSYLFRVVSVDYDNIKSNNYYKISFKLEFIDEDKRVNLENQVHEKFDCVLENIGTENNCIISEEYVSQLKEIDRIYSSISNLYLTMFYNERYNCIVGEMPCCNKFYDPYMIRFINEHQLFNHNNNLETFIFNEEGYDGKRKVKYEKSFYRFIEKRSPKGINNFYYRTYSALNEKDSIFARWHDDAIYMIDIPVMVDTSTKYILNDQFLESIRNEELDEENLATKMIQKFILNQEISIYDVNDELYNTIVDNIPINIETFFFVPVILYIIKVIKSEFLKSKK